MTHLTSPAPRDDAHWIELRRRAVMHLRASRSASRDPLEVAGSCSPRVEGCESGFDTNDSPTMRHEDT